MDGNGRWAKKRLLPRFAGHKAGVETVRGVVKSCIEQQIPVLTLFAFSSENWRRPAEEVGLLMELFMSALDREVTKLHRNGVKLQIIGDLARFNPQLRQRIAAAHQLTTHNDRLQLNIAANYGGRWDIVQACRHLASEVAAGRLDAEAISESLLAQQLTLSELPEPDLFIRTGGEQRVSNFLLWQLAYTELYFTDKLWPDFNVAEFQTALDSFSLRQRRFGRTGDQVTAGDHA